MRVEGRLTFKITDYESHINILLHSHCLGFICSLNTITQDEIKIIIYL